MKQKICIISSYSIWPPVGGGQSRIFNIAKNLSDNFDVTVLTISPGIKNEEITIGNLQIINIKALSLFFGSFLSKISKLPIGEIFLPYSSKFAFSFRKTLTEFINAADVLIIERPYLFSLVKKYITKKKIIYDAHDVEIILKENFFTNNHLAKEKLMPIVKKTEKFACNGSNMIFTPSEIDKQKIKDIYRIPSNKIHIIPNGVDCSEIQFSSDDEKKAAKRNLGFDDEILIVFMGSSHPPNIKAAEFIISNIAPKFINYKFLIMGSVKTGIKKYVNNVILTGIVNYETKKEMLKAADIALNPISYGSGTNLKLLEFLAAGIPTISTPVGVRGLKLPDDHILISDLDNFHNSIQQLMCNPDLLEKFGKNGRIFVEQKYDWLIISGTIRKIINNIDS